MYIKILIWLSLKCPSSISFEPSDFYASSVAVYRNRAFLTVPRSSCYNNVTNPTLIEASFNPDQQSLLFGRKFIYPGTKQQIWGNCAAIQDATYVDVENKKGRLWLWVLDKGTRNCPPKLVAYSLFNNFEVLKSDFETIASKHIKVFAIDPKERTLPLVYISSGGENELIVFSPSDHKWWTVEVSLQSYGSVVGMDRLVLSKFERLMYLTADKDLPLYYLNLTDLRSQNKPQRKTVQVQIIGEKLGKSSGIATDIAGGLNYYMVRDYAVVRWMTNNPLTAEHHDVLYQSDEVLPYVPHLFQGPQNNIWALVNPLPPKECSNLKDRLLAQLAVSQDSRFKQKLVQVLKLLKKGLRKKFSTQ